MYDSGRYYKQDNSIVKMNSLQERFNRYSAYIYSKWLYFKIGTISILSLIALFIIISFIRCILRCFKKCRPKEKNRNERAYKSINLIKAFLPQSKESNVRDTNIAMIKRSNSVDSIQLDKATNEVLEKIRKYNQNRLFY